MSPIRKAAAAPIPQTRLGRFARIGVAAGEFAAGTAVEELRRLVRSDALDVGSALLSATNVQRLAARLAHLRGAAMKIGQLASLQGEDILPPEFARALAVPRAQATPMPLRQLRGVLGVAALLRLFNLLPLGLDVTGIAAEAKRQLAQEADYLSEARFLERYAQLVLSHFLT